MWWLWATMGLKILQTWQQNKAMVQAAQSQINAQTYDMNMQLQNYEQERMDARDAAMTDILQTQQNALQLNSQVEAAVNEDYAGGGRTADQVMRSTVGDTARNIASIQDNYRRKSNEIDLNKYSTAMNAFSSMKGIAKGARPNRTADFLGFADTFFKVRSTQRDIRMNRMTKGASN